MVHRTIPLLFVVLALVFSACGGGQPETCDEIADATIELMQELIDDVDDEVGDTSVEELIAADAEHKDEPAAASPYSSVSALNPSEGTMN